MTTVLDALTDRLTGATKHNRSTEQAPVAVLWTDGDRKWEPALTVLRARLPNLWTLGEYDPDAKQGPAAWVKWRLGNVAAREPAPVIYLPGVRRLQFRSLEDFPEPYKPIAELQFRGTWWTQQNGKDWTPLAFLSSKKGGLGLPVAEDQATVSALERLIVRVLDADLAELKKPSRLEAEQFVTLLIDDADGDLLDWLDDPGGVRKGCPDDKWTVFRDFVRQRLDVDLDRDGAIVVGERLTARSGGWAKVWKRYADAVSETNYARVHLVLEKVTPPLMLFGDKSAYPSHNEQQEQALRKALTGLGELPEAKARETLRALEAEHAPRRGWVWAKLGKARMATVLQHLVALADATAAPIAGSTRGALTAWYAEGGYQADAAALAALALADHTDGAAIQAAVRGLYLPWLQRAAERLAEVVKVEGYPTPERVPVEDGTCLLFADGLRWDVGAMLAGRLLAVGRRVAQEGRWVAFPPVTGTSKPDVSPIRDQLGGGRAGADSFKPSVKATGKVLDSATFSKLMANIGVQVLAGNDTGDPSGRAWTEFGDIDKYGHEHGCKTAGHVDAQLREMEQRVAELLDAGWKQVRVTTDHGWLLVPSGLPTTNLPSWLTDARWQRCALVKATSSRDLPSLPWAWDPHVDVAFPPGVDAFSIQTGHSREYAHGGLTLQECYTPVLTVSLDQPAVDGKLGDLKWVSLRCKATIRTSASAGGLLRLDLRAKVADATTSLLDAPKAVGADGTVSVLVPDDSKDGTAAFAVLLAPDGSVLDKRSTTIGGDA
ncbi:MAG: BREX-1 system phosphatase PglZ type B [Nannocystis sp.]|nr:BREX-1 system phosphatase PglZ type B [Nannocystis sp.]